VTTIAYDGKALAGDRQCAGAFKTQTRKVWRLPNGSLFGGAGVTEQVLAVRAWLQEGGDKPDGLEDFNGILVEGGVIYRLEEKLIRDPILERCHAVGSGSPFAITAMHLGKTAREAVLIAARFDPRTGGGVDVLARQSSINVSPQCLARPWQTLYP
jgi:hypothetical protein